MRSRNIVRESPGVSVSITICLTIPLSSAPTAAGKIWRSSLGVEPMSRSGQDFGPNVSVFSKVSTT